MKPKLSTRTASKYKGAMATNYETKRMKQMRWHRENEIVAGLLSTTHGLATVLDVPVGTGRYLALYQQLGLNAVGVDTSTNMLALAQRKMLPVQLVRGSALALGFQDQEFDAVVCVRFLDLIEEEAMRQAVKEICRVA